MNTLRIPTPTVIESSENQLVLELHISDQLIYFPGHFPVHSILPGVVILDWVMDLAKEHMGLTPATPLQMEVIKFKQVVETNTDVRLELKHNVSKNKLVYKLSSSHGEHSSGRILLVEQGSTVNDKS